KSIELYLFDDRSKAKECERLVEDPQAFNKPLPDGTTALVWHKTTSGGYYKPGGSGSPGHLFRFFPQGPHPQKAHQSYHDGDLPEVKITSRTKDRLTGSVTDAKGDKSLRTQFVARVCP